MKQKLLTTSSLKGKQVAHKSCWRYLCTDIWLLCIKIFKFSIIIMNNFYTMYNFHQEQKVREFG